MDHVGPTRSPGHCQHQHMEEGHCRRNGFMGQGCGRLRSLNHRFPGLNKRTNPLCDLSQPHTMSFNSYSSKLYDITDIHYAVAFLKVPVGVIGLIGNGIVIWLLHFCIKTNQATIYTLNLALADLIYLLGSIIISLITGNLTDNMQVYTAMKILNNLGFNCSLFLLSALSTERCLSVCFPIWYKCNRPQHLTSITCGVIWVLSLVTSIVEELLYSKSPYFVYITSAVYITVSAITIFSSVVLLIEIQKRSEACRPIKLYIVIVANIVSFFVSLVSVKVAHILLFFRSVSPFTNIRLHMVTSLCAVINSCANPFIYILVGSWGKNSSIKEALEKVFKEEEGNSTEIVTVSGGTDSQI
ncbi:mas-related G-protein coupled receptor member H-like [Bombina bombina]|uniref:mas-related G-protein coupled receptor member H-like n=1 Tax=Bombina bombina TaxID=8345 RepID=UPI00235A8742|nr:mas-related G-protein coupled receptor member H-like [Bombina bombina]